MKKYEVVINKEKCIGCGSCTKTCAAHNLCLKNQKAEKIIEDCILCGQCTAVCPTQAITISHFKDKAIEKEKEVRLNPQEVLDVIRFRRTIRQFQSKAIPQEVIQQILEAGRLNHTAHNSQDVSYVVLDKEKDRIEKMAVNLFKTVKPIVNLFSPMARQNEITEHFFFFEAPIVIVIVAKNQVNGLLAAQNMEFVAEANGLGVLYSGFFTTAANLSYKIKKAIQLPKKKKVAMTLVLGYPKGKFLRSVQRKELDVKMM